MALEFIKLQTTPRVKLDRKLWYTADRSRVVEDGDPRAASLLGTAGKEVELEEAIRVKLVRRKTKESSEIEAGEVPGVDLDDEGAEDDDDLEPTEDVEDMTVEELKEELKARDLPVSGNKDELIKRLQQDVQDKMKTPKEDKSG